MRTPPWMLLLWSGIYFIILLSLYTPFSILTISFIMIPGLILYGLSGRQLFLFYYGLPLVVILALLQGMGLVAILVSLFFVVPTVVIGEIYRRRLPARNVLFAGTMTIIAELLLLMIGAYAFGYHPIQEIQQYLWDSYLQLPEMFRTEMTDQTMDLTISLAARMLPVFMIMTGLFYTSVTHALGGRILRTLGVNAPALPPIRKWMLPKSLIWYYLILLLLDLFIAKDINSIMTMVVLNGYWLLTLLFAIQAISFLSFIGHRRRGGALFPILGAIFYFFMPGFISLLGVLDVAFPIREGIKNR